MYQHMMLTAITTEYDDSFCDDLDQSSCEFFLHVLVFINMTYCDDSSDHKLYASDGNIIW